MKLYKKGDVRNARATNKGTLVVEVSSENDKESAVSVLKEGFSKSYVVEGAEMLLPIRQIYQGMRF